MKTNDQTRRRINPRLLACTLGLAVMATGAQAVEARSVTPLNGKPWFHSQGDCFTNSWNMVENNCPNERKWLIDAPIDTTGDWHGSLSIYGQGTGTSVVKCWFISTSGNGLMQMSVYGERGQATYGELALNQLWIFVPWDGVLHVDCDLPAFTGGTKGGVSAFHYDA